MYSNRIVSPIHRLQRRSRGSHVLLTSVAKRRQRPRVIRFARTQTGGWLPRRSGTTQCVEHAALVPLPAPRDPGGWGSAQDEAGRGAAQLLLLCPCWGRSQLAGPEQHEMGTGWLLGLQDGVREVGLTPEEVVTQSQSLVLMAVTCSSGGGSTLA